MSFKTIPIIDLADALNPQTKLQFLEKLRYALIEVGFLILINFESVGPSKNDFEEIKQQALQFFALPKNVKEDCEMIHSPHFLGYSRLGNEITGKKTDWREQIDLATELPEPLKSGPLYRQLEGPNLWPEETHIPDFRPTVTRYIKKMTQLSSTFRRYVSEAVGLNPNGLDPFFKENQQCKMKLILYPDISSLKKNGSNNSEELGQGVGPHRDSDLLTYIYQCTDHQSLQVQNFQGDWVTVENIPNSLVINVGQTLEAITDGVCKATIHRVVTPTAGSGIRLSIPFFQTINVDSHKTAISSISSEIIQLRDERDKKINNWGIETGFQFTPDLSEHPVGYAVFRNRIKSHQDVAARWYPEVLREVLREI